MSLTIPKKWTDHLGLSYRKPPEFYQASDKILNVSHAGALRDSFEELGLSAIFCVKGVPTIAFLLQEEYERKIVLETHAALWNQGLASLLVVITGDTIRAFSLARRTVEDSEEAFENKCLINIINLLSSSLVFKDLIYGVESGRLWDEYSDFFKPDERIDNVLLNNLSNSHQFLQNDGLSNEQAQALLMQVMFIAYLEDRGIITEQSILEATKGKVSRFESILSNGDGKAFELLFKSLRKDFNGDLFFAPCSFEKQKQSPKINHSHFSVLARFRSGHEEMHSTGGQFRLWGYNFKFIPVELISAVYDRFLGKEEKEKKNAGAYYTPLFLVETVTSQIWDSPSLPIKDNAKILDPACGSGVFLVRAFQRLCEQWKNAHPNKTIRWDSLCKILDRIHGWDCNPPVN